MAWFGVNELRFLPPVAWAFLVLAALLCVPSVARRALPALRTPGDWIVERPGHGLARARDPAGGPRAAPARPHGVRRRLPPARGLGRRGRRHAHAVPAGAAARHRASLPPRGAAANFHLLDANATARALGAVEAFVLGALAVAFARAVRTKGAAACLVAAAVAFTGALGLMTGYGKAFSEMCLLTLATATFAIRVGARRRAHWRARTHAGARVRAAPLGARRSCRPRCSRSCSRRAIPRCAAALRGAVRLRASQRPGSPSPRSCPGSFTWRRAST